MHIVPEGLSVADEGTAAAGRRLRNMSICHYRQNKGVEGRERGQELTCHS